jgi:hAT family C-terminal dimerisation region
MDIIPIQASSVPCERVFSSGKQTMAPRRGRLSAKVMEALQLLKFSIRKGRPLKFTEGMSWSEELKEFEMLATIAPVGDAEAYGRSLEESGEDSDILMEAIDDLRIELETFDRRLEELEEEDDKDSEESEEDDEGDGEKDDKDSEESEEDDDFYM